MKITFVTTSTFSDVQKTQSECIKKWFPNSEHIIHAWHQRERNLNRVVSPIHKYPNNIRYDMLISNINKLNNFNEN